MVRRSSRQLRLLHPWVLGKALKEMSILYTFDWLHRQQVATWLENSLSPGRGNLANNWEKWKMFTTTQFAAEQRFVLGMVSYTQSDSVTSHSNDRVIVQY